MRQTPRETGFGTAMVVNQGTLTLGAELRHASCSLFKSQPHVRTLQMDSKVTGPL